jgi:predicted ATPase/class 3 adenylate cyclase
VAEPAIGALCPVSSLEARLRCPQCQADNRAGVKFCEDCGAPWALQCPHCGAEVLPEKRFCGACGGSLAAQPIAPAASVSAATPTARLTSPQTYTPQHLAERIISSRGALEGERKQVTVLFADLKGSMELLAGRDPEDARRILDPVLERMMAAVHHYEGTVNQVLGDGIMALFGAPLAHEDHAIRACYAALRMQESVKQYADEVFRTQGIRVQIRVGLNSGEVVVRSIGSDLRMDYTAVGQTTHLAARMEQLATPGSILFAPDTLQLAEGYVQVKGLGPVQVKGLSEPVEVYELLGAGTARSRLQAAAVRGLTKFVGRDAELETLRRTLDLAAAGHGQIVALVGEPGVGKSRLVWEFGHSHRTQGWLVLEAGSFSYGKATSYLPVIALLKSYCGIEDRDDARRMREKLTGKLLTLDPALQPTLPPLLALLDVPVDDPAWNALDPPQRRSRTLEALKRLVLRESQEQPLLLVFEDLHWIDAETQALLDNLVESLPTARLLLLVNYRPEYEHAWHRKTYYQQLRLDPLAPDSADALLVALLGDRAEVRGLKCVLVERTEGNPFFVEESVRTLVESGVLTGDRGEYQLAKPFASTQVPATVQAVLAARIDRLAPEDKRMLQAAAVIGKDVPYVLLQGIAEVPEVALHVSLARLQAAEFLYETSLFPDLEYTFKHALTHEVAYGSLLQERRRALHARIVEAIRALYVDRQAEQVERLAHHALCGEVWPAAWSYLRQAARRAAARSAHREAVAYFEQALEVATRLPPDRESIEQAIDLRFDLCNSLQALADMDRWVQHLHEAERLAESLDDRRRLGWAYALLTTPSSERATPVVAVHYGERGLAIAEELNDLGMQIAARQQLGAAYRTLGNYARSVDLLRRNVAVLCGENIHQRFGLAGYPAVGSRSHLIRTLAECGEFAEAARRGEEALSIAQEKAFAFASIAALTSVSELCVNQGDWPRATALLDEAQGRVEQHQIRFFLPMSNALLGYALVLGSRAREAVGYLERAVEQHSWGHGAAHTLWLGWLAEAYLLAGERERAIDHAERALHLARRRGERGREAYALRLQAEIAAHADPPDAEQVENHYRQALAVAEELGMRPLAAHCHLGLGTLYQQIGYDEQARAELVTAAEMYRAMEMTFWLEKAEATLEQVAG